MRLERRSFGILMPIFSLPGQGTLDGAGEFIAFLTDCGASVWQILPLGPTHADKSPYLSLSAHAGNPRLIGVQRLAKRAGRAITNLEQGFDAVGGQDLASEAYATFANQNNHWLPDFALFTALRRHQGDEPWYKWPTNLRCREPAALDTAREELSQEMNYITWEQFIFFEQWLETRRACNNAGISLLGDVPIYVSHDSADVWQHQNLFQLAEDGSANVVAGVPPDYFSPTGQLWGNPLYDWQRLADQGYQWWIDRMATQAHLFDIVRIDHFRGLESYWEVPGDARTAETGEWRQGPGSEFLRTLLQALPQLCLVAEDLGTITAEVESMRREFDLPGIRVLQFGFDGVWDNPHSPDNIEENAVLYTGTHDNDTSLGWYHSVPDWQRSLVDEKLAHYHKAFPANLVECAFESRARTAIFPVQDLLGLGSECRTNTPGTTVGNWQWQLAADTSLLNVATMLRDLKSKYGR